MSVLHQDWTMTADVIVLQSKPMPMYRGEPGWFTSTAYYRSPKGKDISFELFTKVQLPTVPLTVSGPVSIPLTNWLQIAGMAQALRMEVKKARKRVAKPAEEARAKVYLAQLEVVEAA